MPLSSTATPTGFGRESLARGNYNAISGRRVQVVARGGSRKNSDEWVVDGCLKAMKWHYLSYRYEFFLFSVPLLSAIVLVTTNANKPDRKLQVSYLVKHVCDKEEHQLKVVAGTKDESDI